MTSGGFATNTLDIRLQLGRPLSPQATTRKFQCQAWQCMMDARDGAILAYGEQTIL